MTPRIYAIVFGLFLLTTGCKSTDSSPTANVQYAASSPAAVTGPAELAARVRGEGQG